MLRIILQISPFSSPEIVNAENHVPMTQPDTRISKLSNGIVVATEEAYSPVSHHFNLPS